MKTAKPRLNAREVVADIRSGLSDEQLMSKYGLSAKGLTALFDKLAAANLISRGELEARMSHRESTVDLEITSRYLADSQELAIYSYRWRFPTKAWIVSSPAFWESALFFGSWDGFLYALDSETGIMFWKLS